MNKKDWETPELLFELEFQAPARDGYMPRNSGANIIRATRIRNEVVFEKKAYDALGADKWDRVGRLDDDKLDWLIVLLARAAKIGNNND